MKGKEYRVEGKEQRFRKQEFKHNPLTASLGTTSVLTEHYMNFSSSFPHLHIVRCEGVELSLSSLREYE